MHIACVCERLQIQFRISRSFRPRNLANLGSKIRFWIRRKEHTLYHRRLPYPRLPILDHVPLCVEKVKDINMASWRERRRFLILIVSLAVCLNIIAVKGEGNLACVVQNTDDKTLHVKLGCNSSDPHAVAWGKFRDEIHSTG